MKHADTRRPFAAAAALGLAALLAPALTAAPAAAGAPEVLEVRIDPAGQDGTDRFFNVHVTVKHADEGWNHYADAFEVLDADTGKLLGVRELAHPHENEQPFTRTLYRLVAPVGVTRVLVRAHDSVHGYGASGIEVSLDP